MHKTEMIDDYIKNIIFDGRHHSNIFIPPSLILRICSKVNNHLYEKTNNTNDTNFLSLTLAINCILRSIGGEMIQKWWKKNNK